MGADERGPDSEHDRRSARSAPIDRQKPLTHRPRGLATLNPSAIQTATTRDLNPRSPANRPYEKRSGSGRVSATVASGASYEVDAAGEHMGVPLGEVAPDLRPFADQLIAIAEKLRSADFRATATPGTPHTSSHGVPQASPNGSPPVGPHGSSSASAQHSMANDARHLAALDGEAQRKAFAEMARASYTKRRKRATIFGDSELFGEPAWDILLDLYIAEAEEKSVSVSSACIGSAAPPTTGLRWLGVLAEQGLVAREHDPQDQRRVLVRLTEKALDAMDTYFSSSAGLSIDRRSARA